MNIEIEMGIYGDETLYAEVEIEVTVDEGTKGSLMGRSVEFDKIINFDYILENSYGDFIEGERGCSKRTHPNTHQEIESYINLNWDKIIQQNSTKLFC